jgi:hypothetical protein
MSRRARSLLCLAGLALAATSPALGDGPDVIVGDLPNVQYWGVVAGPLPGTSDDIVAYSIGTTSCNIGTQQLSWIETTNRHPVIAQNLYRLKNGRFEQIGMSWLKHGFCALQETVCSSTPGYPPCSPAGFACENRLGVGCSDPYSSALNGTQSRLGPRSHVNAFTGEFPYPFQNPGPGFVTPPPASGVIARRLQVAVDDVTPSLNQGATYFVEGQYVALDDASAGNGNNNTSYRRVQFNSVSQAVMVGPTQRQKPAIQGWKEFDSGVTLAILDVPGEGRFYLAGKAIDNGDGTWTYNYALYNMNSHASAGSITFELGCGATVLEQGFSAPKYHSGEVYSNAPWVATEAAAGSVTFATESESQNPNANAVRWGTTYTFWLKTDSPPATGNVTVGLWRNPGGTLSAGGFPVPGAVCRADWSGDGGVNSADISAYLTDWLESVQVGNDAADYNCDATVNSSDISAFLTSWLNAVNGTGC